MPKVKTKKAIKKRFRVSATGKMIRCKQGRRHILTKKSPKRKRHLKKRTVMDPSFAKLYKRLARVA
ncbi:MAG: 50S ribosomal protein L35 [Simkaniaceae bacterium]|nr:50S ribosomal protein L35 [Simkaniaceae bacterium]